MAPASHSSDAANTHRYTSASTPSRSAVLIPPKAAEGTDPEMNLERPSLKRKDIEPSGSNRFKIVTQLIIAMKRFQASLNPTYTYGKRPTPSNSSSGAVSSQGRSLRRSTTPVDTLEVTSVQEVARQNSRSGEKGACKAPRPRNAHGHKTAYLLGALPPAPGEAGGRPPTPTPKTDSRRSLSSSSNQSR